MLSVSCTYHHPTVNIASMWMHATMESVLSWNIRTPEGQWKPCAFSSRKLEGKDGRGQRAWSTRKQETYALVSCLLKFKSWIRGQKVTVYTDHKSLESWYKEDLCTLSGPSGRRGRWHEAGTTLKWCTNPARTTLSPMGCPGGHIRPDWRMTESAALGR